MDSLKAIAKYFSVSVDDLLSSDTVLTIAEEDQKRSEKRFNTLAFGLLDCSAGLLLFLPSFGERGKETAQAVSLLSFAPAAPYIKFAFLTAIISLTLCGIAALALQSTDLSAWQRNKDKASLVLGVTGVLLFVVGLQPYAAVFAFVLLVMKALLLIKWS